MKDGRAEMGRLPVRRSGAVALSLLIIPAGIMAAVFSLSPGSADHSARSSPVLRSSSMTAPAVTSANSSAFVYAPPSGNSATSGMTQRKGDPGMLTLTVYGQPPSAAGGPTGGSSALVYADLYNGTDHKVIFPGGAAIRVTIRRDGRAWKEAVLDQPATTSLDAGQRTRLETTVPLDGAARYELSAELVGRGSNPAYAFAR